MVLNKGKKLRVRSRKWYDDNVKFSNSTSFNHTTRDDQRRTFRGWFGPDHAEYCGKVVTIKKLEWYNFAMLATDIFIEGNDLLSWEEWMFEETFEETEKKTEIVKNGFMVTIDNISMFFDSLDETKDAARSRAFHENKEVIVSKVISSFVLETNPTVKEYIF